MKTYEIDGKTFSQGRITYDALLRLVALFEGRAAAGGSILESLNSVGSIMGLLADHDLRRGFLSCILTGPVDELDMGAIGALEMMKVVTDFLYDAAPIISASTDLFGALTSLVTDLAAKPKTETPQP